MNSGEITTSDLRSVRFRKERENSWKSLEDLIKRVEASGMSSLSFEEARDLSALYAGLSREPCGAGLSGHLRTAGRDQGSCRETVHQGHPASRAPVIACNDDRVWLDDHGGLAWLFPVYARQFVVLHIRPRQPV